MALTQVSSDGIKNLNVKTADLENSGVTAGTYGSASLIPALVIDAKGRVTSASTNAITQVGGSNGVDFNDNVKARFGTGNDLQIYHDGSGSHITESGTGLLDIDTNTFRVRNTAGNENQITAEANGAVGLYYDNSKKFDTNNLGVRTHGTHFLDGDVHFGNNGFTDGILWDKSASTMRWKDNNKALFGDGSDLQIYHDGTDSFIKQATATPLKIQNVGSNGADVHIQARPDEEGIKLLNNSGESKVELYYDNSKKFETTSVGVKLLGSGTDAIEMTGDVWFNNNEHAGADIYFNSGDKHLIFEDEVKAKFGGAGDLEIYHDGSNSYIKDAGTGYLKLVASVFQLRNAADNETMIEAHDNGQVELYHNDTKVFNTTNYGALLTGQLYTTDYIYIDNGQSLFLQDNGKLMIGTGNDLQIYHNGTNSVINNATNDLRIESDRIELNNEASDEFYLTCTANGAVELYHNGTKKFETSSSGAKISSGHFYPANNNSQDLGLSSSRWRNIYTNDLNLSNEGGANDVDGTWGSYTIQEGAEDLFLINRRNGKKYKFNLTEVS